MTMPEVQEGRAETEARGGEVSKLKRGGGEGVSG